MLQLSADQKKLLADFQKSTDETIAKVLTPEQKKQLADPMSLGVPPFLPPGEVLPVAVRNALKLTDEQKNQVDELQKTAQGKLDSLLTEGQKKQLADMRPGFGPGGQFNFGPGFGPPGFGGRRGGGPLGPPPIGKVVPPFVPDALQLSAEQRTKLDELQKSVDDQIAKVLTEDQRKQLQEPLDPGVLGPVPPGEILPPPVRNALGMTGDQKNQIDELQKSTTEKLNSLLTEDQRQQFAGMREGFNRGGPFAFNAGPGFDGGPRRGGPGRGGPPDGGRGGPGPGGPGRRGGPGFGGPGFTGPGGPGFGGPGGGSSLFRSYRYAADYPAFAGKTLTPGKKLEELERPASGAASPRPNPVPAPAATVAPSDEKREVNR
jgi:Spy/CpxP family protein refolding chaperone